MEYGEKGGNNDGDKTEIAAPLTSSIFVEVEYEQMGGYTSDVPPLFPS